MAFSQRAAGTQQARGPLQPKSLGGKACFKCGQNGHWSKDCTVPKDQWIPQEPRQIGGASQQPPQQQGAQQAAVTLDADGNPVAPAAAKKPARKRIKLTVEALAGPEGLAYCYGQLAPAFENGFRGDGHEARDLGRLLDLYRGWQRRLIPGMPFGEFVEAMERHGSTRLVQHMMKQLRQKEVEAVWQSAHGEADPAADNEGDPVGPHVEWHREGGDGDDGDGAGYGGGYEAAEEGAAGAAGGAGGDGGFLQEDDPPMEDDLVLEEAEDFGDDEAALDAMREAEFGN